MRVLLLNIAAALAAIVTLIVLAVRPGKGARFYAPAEPRRAAAKDEVFAQLSPVAVARAGSLWKDRAGTQCHVAARWATAPAAAEFGSMMRLSLKAAQRSPAIAAQAAAWVAREELRLDIANDADIAARYAEIRRGETPIVRVLKAASFRARKARFGRQEARLAA
jgi:hypothetical protein